uniref:Putative retrotransposon Ty1-copia subclass protein n=1 Tax=Tanacetum cinerariifolium TaxID=118510 RepID=A0A6L2J7Q9_TANCI|nr:putative retrotransposon Ty1-copia subclass protein [Tanacetum cinerariifolium]
MIVWLVLQGLRGSRKLKHEALILYIGNGMHAAVKASGSHGVLDFSGSHRGLEIIQKEDTQPSKNTSKVHNEVVPIEVEPQNVKVPILRSTRIPQAPDRYGFYVVVKEHDLGDLNEPPNYKDALSNPEFEKWLEARNTKMQSMKENQVWVLVDLPANDRTIGSKCLFKKKRDMYGNVHTFKARLVAKGYTQNYDSLLITHQGNIQVKDNKIDLLVQQYEQFTILEEESIDSGFARFKTIITSLKALDKGFSSKNNVRKFLWALHPKCRAKVMAIKESKDLSSLALYELIDNLKKESSDDETLTSRSDDEEYAMVVRNFKKFFRGKGKSVRQPREEKKSFQKKDEKNGKSDRKFFRCDDPNHLIGDCPKPHSNKDQKAFIGGSWSDSKNEANDKTNNESCLMAQSSNEVTLDSSHYNDNASSFDDDRMQIEYDNLCEISLKIINKNKK